MRRFYAVFCLAALLISLCGCFEKEYTHGVYEVKITWTMLYNDSVGNEWNFSCRCEEESIYSGKRWTLPLGAEETVTLNATVTEVDEWCDVGSGQLTVEIKDDFKTSTTIEVTENKGRFIGNSAVWKITCSIKLVEKIEAL